MVSPHTMQRTGHADWALMNAIHDTLRRDLDELLHTTASRTSAQARWIVFRDQLRFHLAPSRRPCGRWPGPGWPTMLTARPNPVPASRERPQALGHRSPLEPAPVFRRGRLRQKVPVQAPRSIPDQLWDELFAVMGCDRDRALLEFYVSSSARASELLGIGLEDIDWPGQLIYVISKGTRIRQPVPASPNAFRYLGSYLAADGLPDPGSPCGAPAAGDPRPLTYWAMRRILQRANDS